MQSESKPPDPAHPWRCRSMLPYAAGGLGQCSRSDEQRRMSPLIKTIANGRNGNPRAGSDARLCPTATTTMLGKHPAIPAPAAGME